MVGVTQQKIVEDSYKKKYFFPEDIRRYYVDLERAKSSFDSLVRQGYFDKGAVRSTGSIVYISKQCQEEEKKLTDFKAPVADALVEDDEEFFACPKLEKDAKPFGNLTTLDTCESTGLETGCMYLKTCPAYQERKEEWKKKFAITMPSGEL